MSQAFNTPIGSLLFVLEEFDFVRRSHVTFVMIVACSVPATIVSLALKRFFNMSTSFLSLPPPAGLSSESLSLWYLMFMAILIGIITAFVGEFFSRSVLFLRTRSSQFVKLFDNKTGDDDESDSEYTDESEFTEEDFDEEENQRDSTPLAIAAANAETNKFNGKFHPDGGNASPYNNHTQGQGRATMDSGDMSDAGSLDLNTSYHPAAVAKGSGGGQMVPGKGGDDSHYIPMDGRHNMANEVSLSGGEVSVTSGTPRASNNDFHKPRQSEISGSSSNKVLHDSGHTSSSSDANPTRGNAAVGKTVSVKSGGRGSGKNALDEPEYATLDHHPSVNVISFNLPPGSKGGRDSEKSMGGGGRPGHSSSMDSMQSGADAHGNISLTLSRIENNTVHRTSHLKH